MALRHAFVFLAERIQEAGESLSSNEMRSKLSHAVDSAHAGTGQYADYLDHTGDENSGVVRYAHSDRGNDSSMKQAPYSKGTASSDSDYSVDTAKAKRVAPVTTYQELPDDCDGYAAMEAAKLYTAGPVPLNERFVSKKERDAADSSDFAGKGKSFPILRPEDVDAALHSLGRAGSDNHSVATIRANIIKIAKRKGYALPASAESGDTKESASATPGYVPLIESAGFPTTFEFREAASATNPLVKIISPGRGSSGYYGKEVLQKAAESKVFGRGTLMYFNHATKAEEAQRPEGDWNKLAAVTTGDAYWDENGKDGPALYAPAKVFAKHAAEVAEKAPHTGVSIRASGTRDDKAMGPDGKPGVITALHHAESIDLVTKAGRDGKLLLESADPNFDEGGQMADTELKKLQEATRNINLRLAQDPARRLAEATLADLRLPAVSRMAIVERAISHVTVNDAGAFDEAAFKSILEAEINYAASFVQGGVKAVGVGAAQAAAADPKIAEAIRQEGRERMKESLNRSAGLLGLESKEAKRVFREGRSAFDPTYNARRKQEVA